MADPSLRGTVEDVTERRLYQTRIEHQANYDTLTGLANRSLLQDRLEQALLTAAGFVPASASPSSI